MAWTRILLLSYDLADELAVELLGVLRSALRQDIQLQHEIIKSCQTASVEDAALAKLFERSHPDLCFLVLSSHSLEQKTELLNVIRDEASKTPIIAVMEEGDPIQMFELLKIGVLDFITPPLTVLDILPRIWRLMEQTHPSREFTQALKKNIESKPLIGQSSAFLTEINKIPLIAQCDANVLISGETGTGKELCARSIHYFSARAASEFVPVNCGAIPNELVENELFGHERGAFTGASTASFGLIHEADGGTLFLDEIDCLSPPAQVKLLRFLQDKEYRPLGSTKACKVNVRVITATNAELKQAVLAGKIRRDLYYRLNVFPIQLPPLRDRQEDILLLARHFLAKFAAKFNKQVNDFSQEAIRSLMLYDWPGNVRELEHTVERAVILSASPVSLTNISLPEDETIASQESFRKAKSKNVMQFEKRYILGLLLAYQGNVTRAAQAAQKDRRSFCQLIRKHEIDMQQLRAVAK